MANSYESQQKLNSLVANDVTPQLSTVDVLSSLKLISHFESPDVRKTVAGEIAQKEIEYLKLGFQAVRDNPALSDKFGNGFQGGMAVASLLKAKQAERVYDDIIGKILETNDSTKLNNVIGRLNKGAGGAISGK